MNLAATGSVFPLAEMAADKFPFEPFVPKTFRFVLGTFLVSRRLKLSLKLQKRDGVFVTAYIRTFVIFYIVGPKTSPCSNCQVF